MSALASAPDDPWRLILGAGAGLDPAGGATNMAIDAALLDAVQRGAAPVLRFYRWAPACLSFGRNQPARGLYDLAGARARGIEFVRRPTGGQAVLHADELTYAIVAPVQRLGRPRDAYGRINRALLAGLQAIGVAADLAPPSARPVGDWGAACFRRPEAGEVVAAGRKLVGSAQRMEGRVILQHGSLLLGGSQAVAEELLAARATVPVRLATPAPEAVAAVPAAPAGWTTLDEALGERPGLDALVDALVRGFEGVFGTSLAPAGLTAPEAEGAGRLEGWYGSGTWTWRR